MSEIDYSNLDFDPSKCPVKILSSIKYLINELKAAKRINIKNMQYIKTLENDMSDIRKLIIDLKKQLFNYLTDDK